MASMRDIQRRKISVQSTGQITKAMKLVATVKLQKARDNAMHTRPYFEQMCDAIESIMAYSPNVKHEYMQKGATEKKAVIVITSNRGLAGGYNTNVTKLLTHNDKFKSDETIIYSVGKKGKDVLARQGYAIKKDFSDTMNQPAYEDAMEIGKAVLQAFRNKEVGEVYLAYTAFKNTVSHIPTVLQLLPLPKKELSKEAAKQPLLMNYEPNENEVLNEIVPIYMNCLIYDALMEALASENGARMTAMDAATNNAEEMVSELALKYNRARQSAITQELTEIIAGAEAIS